VLRHQLRAMIAAAAGRRLVVMFPMVAEVAEFDQARAILDAELQRAARTGSGQPQAVRVGAMLEVPALMWQLDELLREVDFVSVGSNDLLQFLFAADRSSASLFNRYDLLSQPVLRLLENLLTAARGAKGGAGVPVSLCGEHASRPLEALALVGLGFTSLSMPASGILPIKALLAELDLGAFGPVLSAMRRNTSGAASLREPIGVWAREHGLPV